MSDDQVTSGRKHAAPLALTDEEKLRRLPWALGLTGMGAIFSTLTVFGPFFWLFLSELNLPKTRIGMLFSIMPFCGPLSLLVGSHALRFGVKRVFVIFESLRMIVLGGLLWTPAVTGRWGTEGGFYFIAAILVIFSLLRAVAETASKPWVQEYVPEGVRGRFFGLAQIVSGVLHTAAVALAGWVLGRVGNLRGFVGLMAVGILAGLLECLMALQVPGGAPRRDAAPRVLPRARELFAPLADPGFRRFMLGAGLVWLAANLGGVRVLFMKEEIGLSAAQVVTIHFYGSLLGLFTCYLWGWIADRMGGRTVLLWGLLVVGLVIPFNLAVPRTAPWNFYASLAISLTGALFNTAWMLGEQRLLYNRVVPPDRSMAYMVLYYAWLGLVTGSGPPLGGWLTDRFRDLHGAWGPLHLDAYTPMFAVWALCALAGLLLFLRVKADPPTIGRGAHASA